MARTINQSRTSLVILSTILFNGCQTVTPAPGSDNVHVTDNQADVAGCKPVGNITVPKLDTGAIDIANGPTELRNRTIGLGGNTALVTSGNVSMPVEGIAYHCE